MRSRSNTGGREVAQSRIASRRDTWRCTTVRPLVLASAKNLALLCPGPRPSFCCPALADGTTRAGRPSPCSTPQRARRSPQNPNNTRGGVRCERRLDGRPAGARLHGHLVVHGRGLDQEQIFHTLRAVFDHFVLGFVGFVLVVLLVLPRPLGPAPRQSFPDVDRNVVHLLGRFGTFSDHKNQFKSHHYNSNQKNAITNVTKRFKSKNSICMTHTNRTTAQNFGPGRSGATLRYPSHLLRGCCALGRSQSASGRTSCRFRTCRPRSVCRHKTPCRRRPDPGTSHRARPSTAFSERPHSRALSTCTSPHQHSMGYARYWVPSTDRSHDLNRRLSLHIDYFQFKSQRKQKRLLLVI